MNDLVAAVAARHGVGAGRVRPLPSGVANHAFLLGDDLVLRLPRAAAFAADLRKEAAVIPLARAAGVWTAEVVSYDATVPWLVLTRVPGADLASVAVDGIGPQIGRQLARLHRVVTAPPEVPVDVPADPATVVAGLRADGWIDDEAAAWLGEWFARLAAVVPADPPRVLIHGDVAPQNILVSATGALAGIVDWGDAMLADPAVDFAKIRLTDVPAVLAGYRAAGVPDGPWEARVLRHHLLWALGRLRDPAPRPGQRHWSAPPASRLLGLLRFLAEAPEPWRRYLPSRTETRGW